MKNRIVEHPNRYRLKPVEGENGVYDLEPEPGGVTEVGTPINKATLLSDETAALYGGAETPNEAAAAAVNGFNQCAVLFDACYPGTREPVSGTYHFTVAGDGTSIAFTTTGNQARIPVVLPTGSYTVKMTSNPVIPFNNAAIPFTVSFGDVCKTINLFSAKPGVTLFTASGTYAIDSRMMHTLKRDIDIAVVGGGGGGAQGGSGGGGGYLTNRTVSPLSFTANSITVIIGSGGAGGSGDGNQSVPGVVGGFTAINSAGITIASADGGSGGGVIRTPGGDGGSGGGTTNGSVAGNGGTNGADGGSSANGTTPIPGGKGQGNTTLFGGGTGSFVVSPGGGGGSWYDSSPGSGGSPGGGKGGGGTRDANLPGGDGLSYGAGGGGGGGTIANRFSTGGKGYQGLAAIRING